MGKLLDNTKSVSAQIDASVEKVMDNITVFKELFDNTYMLKQFKDAYFLKTLLKEKLELGIRNNENNK